MGFTILFYAGTTQVYLHPSSAGQSGAADNAAPDPEGVLVNAVQHSAAASLTHTLPLLTASSQGQSTQVQQPVLHTPGTSAGVTAASLLLETRGVTPSAVVSSACNAVAQGAPTGTGSTFAASSWHTAACDADTAVATLADAAYHDSAEWHGTDDSGFASKSALRPQPAGSNLTTAHATNQHDHLARDSSICCEGAEAASASAALAPPILLSGSSDWAVAALGFLEMSANLTIAHATNQHDHLARDSSMCCEGAEAASASVALAPPALLSGSQRLLEMSTDRSEGHRDEAAASDVLNGVTDVPGQTHCCAQYK